VSVSEHREGGGKFERASKDRQSRKGATLFGLERRPCRLECLNERRVRRVTVEDLA
jgi:hypothetical protein